MANELCLLVSSRPNQAFERTSPSEGLPFWDIVSVALPSFFALFGVLPKEQRSSKNVMELVSHMHMHMWINTQPQLDIQAPKKCRGMQRILHSDKHMCKQMQIATVLHSDRHITA